MLRQVPQSLQHIHVSQQARFQLEMSVWWGAAACGTGGHRAGQLKVLR